MRSALLIFVAAGLAAAQTSEDDDLQRGMGEAGTSPTEIMRALERHLEKYPKTARRAEIERAIMKSAVDARDNARILKYGESHITRNPDDLVVLERVSRLLTQKTDAASNERALRYAQQFEQGLRSMEKAQSPGTRIDAQLREDMDRGFARALLYQAKALGNLGRNQDAAATAQRSLAAFPAPESAREAARSLMRMGRDSEALPYLADAFVSSDARATDADRLEIRKELGQLYLKLHPDEKGLGDAILAAYDRSIETQNKLRARLRAADPNAGKSNPMDYVVTGVDGTKLDLTTLRGKVVVLDFWATWCGPCRAQYPMYESVKQSFKERSDIVFLGINTDDDRALVKPFLAEQRWNKRVYFEDGLASLMKVSSIPTTMIFDRTGQLSSRMNGFLPERFIEMLTERIRDTLAK